MESGTNVARARIRKIFFFVFVEQHKREVVGKRTHQAIHQRRMRTYMNGSKQKRSLFFYLSSKALDVTKNSNNKQILGTFTNSLQRKEKRGRIRLGNKEGEEKTNETNEGKMLTRKKETEIKTQTHAHKKKQQNELHCGECVP